MDFFTMQGFIAASIGTILFIMGYIKGVRNSTPLAIDALIKLGYLAVNDKGDVIAGPKLK